MMADGPGDPPSSCLTRSDWGLIAVLLAVQFTHMVDFVIIMPLGDRLKRELAITDQQFGLVIAAYAWAAGVANLLASFFVDRFDRRTVLLTMYAGFGLSTLLCGLADSYELLLVARTLAGVFGGVAGGMVMSVIGDVFPPMKRGRAAGAVMSAFAVGTIGGLPLGLWLAELYGRGAPFIGLAVLSAAVWVYGWVKLPHVRGHLDTERRHPLTEFSAVVREPRHVWALLFSAFLVMGTFTVASFIAPVLTRQNGWTEAQLKWVYLVGGVMTLGGMAAVSRLADRVPRLPLFRVLGFAALVLALVISNLPPVPVWVATLVIGAFMVAASGRMVPAQAMLLGTAAPRVRGAFMSLNTAVQHAATGLAPALAGAIIVEGPDKQLTGFTMVGLVSAACAAVSLYLAGRLRSGEAAPPPTPVVEPADEAAAVAS
jgi:predicted MFS family arabinose efflux permease